MSDEQSITCTEAGDLILLRAAGRLDEARAGRLEAHMADCVNCRRDAADTGWLAEQLRAHHARLDEGHLAARLVVEFAESPSEFGDDEQEVIWAHLDACSRCSRDYENAQRLLATRVDLTADVAEQAKVEEAVFSEQVGAPAGAPAGGPPRPTGAPRRAAADWRERLAAVRTAAVAVLRKVAALVPPQRRVAAATTALTVAVAVIVGIVYTSRNVTGGPAAQWASSDVLSSRVPVQELPIRLVTRGGGGGGTGPDATLDMRRIGHLVVVVDLDRIAGGADQYQAVITNAQSAELFRDPIAPKYFDEGRFFLDLRGRRFPAGDYVLQIEAHHGERIAIVARSRFAVRK